MNQRLVNVAAIVFMVCSVVGTSALVWSTIARPQEYSPAQEGGKEVPQWRTIASVGHARGAATASVTLVEFTDYQCPACRAFEFTLDELLRRNVADLRIVYRHFPLKDIHPHALAAANAAECAAAQSRFNEWHRVVFAAQDSLGVLEWGTLGKRAQIPDSAKFERCVQSDEHRAIVDRDVKAANGLQLHATPSILINDSLFTGARSLEVLQGMISAHVARGHANR